MLPEILEKLRVYLNTIPALNCGGCGIAAYAMYKVAEKHGLSRGLIYMYDISYAQDFEMNCEVLRGNSSRLGSCAHVGFVYNNTIFDSTGRISDSDYILQHIVSEEFILQSLLDTKWSQIFNRAKYLPEIEEYIGFKLLKPERYEIFKYDPSFDPFGAYDHRLLNSFE